MTPGKQVGATALVVDLGGTNARFGLVECSAEGRPCVESLREYVVADFESLAQAAKFYLGQVGRPRTALAVIAVASAVSGDEIRMTNNNWSFSIGALSQDLGVSAVRVINDFVAVGMAISYLRADELTVIGPIPPNFGDGADRHFSIVGPGTGLGVSRLLVHRGQPIVLDTEGGHIDFAPRDDYEIAVLRHLWQRHRRVSVERVICGPGLENLYRSACAVDGVPQIPDLSPERITAAAEQGDAGCRRAVELFCAILGGFAGDVVLMHGAWHGLYLGGGMTPKLLGWLQSGGFRERFEAKGRFSELMRTVSTQAIVNPHAGLLGAAVVARQSLHG